MRIRTQRYNSQECTVADRFFETQNPSYIEISASPSLSSAFSIFSATNETEGRHAMGCWRSHVFHPIRTAVYTTWTPSSPHRNIPDEAC